RSKHSPSRPRRVDEPRRKSYDCGCGRQAAATFEARSLAGRPTGAPSEGGCATMPLFEVETDSHIIITWASDEDAASELVNEAYPSDRVIRLTKRPRDTWVISKSALGIARSGDPCSTAR